MTEHLDVGERGDPWFLKMQLSEGSRHIYNMNVSNLHSTRVGLIHMSRTSQKL